MPPCGKFSHDLLDPRDRGTWDNVKLVRCTIVAINPRYNTADVELGEDPPAGVPYPELTDIDCPDIPVFTGDGWSEDNKRRKFNAVPFYYHCQGSAGTVAELKTGHMAFEIPLAELTHPPWTQQTVDDNHALVIREKALMLFIPPTKEELNTGVKGYRYIIGHTDRNDIAPCKSEYICLRLHSLYNDSAYLDLEGTPNPEYGFSPDEHSVVCVVDIIGNKIYQGLKEYGITFPCLASDIISLVASVELDINTPLWYIAFLDTLHEMTPLYQHAFVYGIRTFYTSTYYIPTYHEYRPTKLHWLTGCFDYSVQAPEILDKSVQQIAYRQCYLFHHNYGELFRFFTNGSFSWPIQQRVGYPIFQPSDGFYYVETSSYTEDQNVPGMPEATMDVVSTVVPCDDHDITLLDITVDNWIISIKDNYFNGFYVGWPEHQACIYTTVSGQYGVEDCPPTNYYDCTIKHHVPWENDAYFEIATPHNSMIYPTVEGLAIVIGRKATYAIAATFYSPSSGGSAFGYNPLSYYGTTYDRGPANIVTLPGASTFLNTLLTPMYAMYCNSITPVTNAPAILSAFVINVLE